METQIPMRRVIVDALFDGNDYRPTPTEILIRNGRIVEVGTAKKRGSTVGGEIRARFAAPAFIDAHIHLVGYAKSLVTAQLNGVRSVEELKKALKETPKVSGWVFGRGWEMARLRFTPHRRILDELLPDTPCSLRSRCGHSLWVNTAALKTAKVTTRTSAPEGGLIERDEDGAPTGILKENAISLVETVAPSLSSSAVLRKAMKRAVRRLVEFGIGGLCIIADEDDTDRIRNAELPMPFRLLLQTDPSVAIKHFADGVKLYKDGALGNLGALMRYPYAGTKNRGIEVTTDEELEEALRKALGRLSIFAVHAIGDSAVEKVVKLMARYSERAAGEGTLLRVEHFQTATLKAIRTAARHSLIASVQPCHQFGDRKAAKERLKNRTRLMYRLKTMVDAGVVLAFGTDAPVEPPDPMLNIQAALEVGKEGVYGDEALSLIEALRAYTRDAALACNWQKQRGRIAKNYHADMTLFEEDPFAKERVADIMPTTLLISGNPL